MMGTNWVEGMTTLLCNRGPGPLVEVDTSHPNEQQGEGEPKRKGGAGGWFWNL